MRNRLLFPAFLLLLGCGAGFAESQSVPSAPLVKDRVPIEKSVTFMPDELEDYVVETIIANPTAYLPANGFMIEAGSSYNYVARMMYPGFEAYAMITQTSVKDTVDTTLTHHNPFSGFRIFDTTMAVKRKRMSSAVAFGFGPKFLKGLHFDVGILSYGWDATGNMTKGPFPTGAVSVLLEYWYPFIHFNYDVAELIETGARAFRVDTLNVILKNVLYATYLKQAVENARNIADVAYGFTFFEHVSVHGSALSKHRLTLSSRFLDLYSGSDNELNLHAGAKLKPFREGHCEVRFEKPKDDSSGQVVQLTTDRLLPIHPVVRLFNREFPYRIFLTGDYRYLLGSDPGEAGYDFRLEGYAGVKRMHAILCAYYAQGMPEKFADGPGVKFLIEFGLGFFERIK